MTLGVCEDAFQCLRYPSTRITLHRLGFSHDKSIFQPRSRWKKGQWNNELDYSSVSECLREMLREMPQSQSIKTVDLNHEITWRCVMIVCEADGRVYSTTMTVC